MNVLVHFAIICNIDNTFVRNGSFSLRAYATNQSFFSFLFYPLIS